MRGFRSVPLIDIGGLRSPDRATRRRTALKLGAAARDVGFIYITGHGVAPALLAAVRAAARDFFAWPMTEKMACYIGRSSNHSGYAPEGEETTASGRPGKKESYDVGLDYHGPDRAPMLGPNQWPDDPGFRTSVGAYYAAMASLAHTLFAGFACALGLDEGYFEPVLRRPPSQLRLVHYPYDPGVRDREGVGAHTDYECFTILASTAPGLEVMNEQGLWIDAPPVEGAFVINIGELLEIWTNGQFVATTHRVRAVAEERYAFPFFATCDYWTVVEPLPRFVTPTRPALHAPVVAGEHLFAQTAGTFRYLQARLKSGEIGLSHQPDTAFGREARIDRTG